MGLFSFFSGKKEEETDKSQKESHQLAQEAANELNCMSYLDKYRQCIHKNQGKSNFKECVDLMDEFRFCMIYMEQNKQANQPQQPQQQNKLTNKIFED